MGLAANMLFGILGGKLIVDGKGVSCSVSSSVFVVVVVVMDVFPCFRAVVSSVVRLKRRFPVLRCVGTIVTLVFSLRKFGLGGGGGLFCLG